MQRGTNVLRSVFRQPLPKRSPPTLSGALPLLGHMHEFWRNPFELLMRARREAGDVVGLRLLNQNIVVVSGPEANEAFFRAPDDQLCRREAYKLMTPIFGKGVVFDAPRPKMDRQMRMVMPMLRDEAMRTYPPAIAEETERLIAGWGEAGELDVLAFMKELTIYTSTRSLIGDEFRSGITRDFFALYADLERGVHPLAYLMPHLPIPRFKRRDAARAKLQRTIAAMMAKRRANPSPPSDGLQILLDATYEDGTPLSPHEVTGMLIALILAGHHTSAGTLVWCLVELLRNPEFLGPVKDEIDATVCDEPELTYSMLRQMTGLGGVIKEVLRLHPPLIFLFRKVLRDFEVGDFTVPAGSMVCASPAVSHRIEDVFADAHRFDPTRYERESRSNPFSWIGFGGGKHKCIGSAFGTMQIKAILATLWRRYELELVQAPADYEDDYTKPTVLPKGPCLLRYRRRERARTVHQVAREIRDIPTTQLRVIVDRQLCQGHAVCMGEAPEIFEVDDDSELRVVLEAETAGVRTTTKTIRFYPNPELNQQVICAARFCPNHAIRVEEDDD